MCVCVDVVLHIVHMVLFRDGEGQSREPWHGYLFGIFLVLESGFVHDRRFRVPGGSVATEDTPREPCKRTCIILGLIV